ncbi:uncharacterized protein METZ01_LOCUS451855 [marine metagenome]|uniref:Uncharacterized protein n=1 Tax=marine metagenome TaxID=408172 RepID=A0A382ZU83_9ZZZZ
MNLPPGFGVHRGGDFWYHACRNCDEIFC